MTEFERVQAINQFSCCLLYLGRCLNDWGSIDCRWSHLSYPRNAGCRQVAIANLKDLALVIERARELIPDLPWDTLSDEALASLILAEEWIPDYSRLPSNTTAFQIKNLFHHADTSCGSVLRFQGAVMSARFERMRGSSTSTSDEDEAPPQPLLGLVVVRHHGTVTRSAPNHRSHRLNFEVDKMPWQLFVSAYEANVSPSPLPTGSQLRSQLNWSARQFSKIKGEVNSKLKRLGVEFERSTIRLVSLSVPPTPLTVRWDDMPTAND